jgi:hypothetical protein
MKNKKENTEELEQPKNYLDMVKQGSIALLESISAV